MTSGYSIRSHIPPLGPITHHPAGCRQLFLGDVQSGSRRFQPLFDFVAQGIALAPNRGPLDGLPAQARAEVLKVAAAYLPYYEPAEVDTSQFSFLLVCPVFDSMKLPAIAEASALCTRNARSPHHCVGKVAVQQVEYPPRNMQHACMLLLCTACHRFLDDGRAVFPRLCGSCWRTSLQLLTRWLRAATPLGRAQTLWWQRSQTPSHGLSRSRWVSSGPGGCGGGRLTGPPPPPCRHRAGELLPRRLAGCGTPRRCHWSYWRTDL